MSLVHDALRRIADGQPPAAAPARPAAGLPVPTTRARRRGRAIVAGICVVVAPLAFLAGRMRLPEPRPMTAPSVVAVMPAVTATMPSAPTKPLPAAPVPAHAAESAPTLAAAPADRASPPPAPRADAAPARGAAQTTLAGPDEIRVEVRRREAAEDEENAGGGNVRDAIAAMERARMAGDRDAVHAGLRSLSGTLRPDSLTLLRMQAWVAHGDGDLGEAERLYHAIADRVPDDQNAAINLALLQARRGDVEAARTRLQALASRRPASPQISRALAEIGIQAP